MLELSCNQSFSKFQALKLNDDQSVPILVNKHCSGDVKVFFVMKSKAA